MSNKINRKHFILSSIFGGAGIILGKSNSFGNGILEKSIKNPKTTNNHKSEEKKLKICLFSKHLQWLNLKGMALLAAEIGFDGIDLTVRPGGHVLPERVTEDLPKAVEAAENAGLKIFSLTTNILEAGGKYSEPIIRTAANLGIKNYRIGWYSYDKAFNISTNIYLVRQKLLALGKLNEFYGITGDYQNHVGDFGASVWDLWLSLRDINTDFVGCQYDIRHATVESPNSWGQGIELLHNRINTFVVKDFLWEKNIDIWQTKNVPLGMGMVDWESFLIKIKEYNIPGPLILHCEYPLGGAEHGNKELTISKKKFVDVLQGDLATLKNKLTAASLI